MAHPPSHHSIPYADPIMNGVEGKSVRLHGWQVTREQKLSTKCFVAGAEDMYTGLLK